MNDDEFQIYLDSCLEGLESKQQHLNNNYGLGTFEKYNIDLEKEEIHFLKNDHVELKATIIPIGSFNTKSKTWMWGWANEAFPGKLRKKSSKIKNLKEITGFDMFINKMAEIDEDMAWEVTGMAVEYLNSQGAYCSSTNNTIYYYSINEVSTSSS
jgi:hypothetical protein